MKVNRKKENLTTIEMFGGEALFNYSYADNVGELLEKEELFYCGGLLNSTSNANGCPIDIFGNRFSHCYITETNCLIAVCYDEKENRIEYWMEAGQVAETT